MENKKTKKENSNTSLGANNANQKGKKETSVGSVYAKKKFSNKRGPRRRPGRGEKSDEFDQRVVNLARVTRVMAGGKRMRFRACVAIGDKKGRLGLGLAKGADVALSVNKAVNKAKKNIINVSMVNDTIPHEIFHKFGAAKILLRPARQGKGVIAGGAIRIMLELAGVKNISSKNLGTNNKVTIAKCLMEALDQLKKVEKKKKQTITDGIKQSKKVTPNGEKLK